MDGVSTFDRLARYANYCAIGLALFAAAWLTRVWYFFPTIPRCERPTWLPSDPIDVSFDATLLAILAIFIGFALSSIGSGRQFRKLAITLVGVGLFSFLWQFPRLIGREGHAPESAGIANLRTVNIAEVTYFYAHGRWATMDVLVREGLLDERFASTAGVNGYEYKVSMSPSDNYVATATMHTWDCLAKWDFFSEGDGVVKYSKSPLRAPRGKAGMPIP